MDKIKIQLSPTKRVDDAIVFWPHEGPDVNFRVDLMDFSKTVQPGLAKVVYAFDVFSILQPNEAIKFFKGIWEMLPENGEIYIIENDFDYMNRSLLSGDLPIGEFNESFRRATYVNQQYLINLLAEAGFDVKEMRLWQDGLKFPKQHFEFILSAKKTK